VSPKAQGYQLLDHPADVRIRAWGSSLEETFRQAALGMWDLMREESAVPCRMKREILVQGRELEDLLVNFLNEQLFMLEAEGFIVSTIESVELGWRDGRYVLRAIAGGVLVSDLACPLERQVKAATYHDIKVTNCEACVIFDV